METVNFASLNIDSVSSQSLTSHEDDLDSEDKYNFQSGDSDRERPSAIVPSLFKH